MPFLKALPEWNGIGTKPPQSKLNSGWSVGEKPPADWWNWFNNTTYQSIKELQENALHIEKIGIASGIATLGADGKVPAAQLPAATAVSDASTTAKGIVQLNDNVNSTSVTQAATANAVKKANDLANGKYTKPASGILKTDLETAVQTSLGKADSAIQSIPVASSTVAGITKLNDTLTSTSTTEAATANAANAINDSLTTHKGAGGTAHAAAVANGNAGFMTGADKSKLDGVAAGATNYAHPATHPPSIIVQDANNRFMTDVEKTALGDTVRKTGEQTMAGPLSITNQNYVKGNRGISDAELPIAASVWVIFTAVTGIENIGGNNWVGGRLTIPSNGSYLVYGFGNFRNIVAAKKAYVSVFVDGVLEDTARLGIIETTGNANTWVGGSTVLQLNAGQIVDVRGFHTDTVARSCNETGVRIKKLS